MTVKWSPELVLQCNRERKFSWEIMQSTGLGAATSEATPFQQIMAKLQSNPDVPPQGG
jgi:hypothetical protein